MDAAILFFDGDEDSTKAGSSHSQIVSTGDLGTVKFILWGNSSFRCPGSNLGSQITGPGQIIAGDPATDVEPFDDGWWGLRLSSLRYR